MAFKFVVVFAFIAAASGIAVEYHQPQYQQQYHHEYQPAPVIVKKVAVPTYVKQQEYDAPAQYNFNYAVQDDHTGDVKSQEEHREGDNVKGQYSLIDADGFKRTVEYTADEHNGFQAVVHREPLSGYKPAPVQKYIAAPVVPVAKYIAAAPITKVFTPAHASYNQGYEHY